MTIEFWQETAELKRKNVAAQVPKEWMLERVPTPEEEPNAYEYLKKCLPKEENDIADLTIIELAQEIARGTFSSLQVTTIFCRRAALLHQLTNCCSEIFFARALDRAKELDQYFAQNDKVIGPLHGIPISLKDQVNLEGIDSAIGYVSLVNKPIKRAQISNIANVLDDLGAVLYVKTTTPVAMMSAETVSNIYGSTLNSCNRKVSCGGSSGGEGALVGARASLLGLGTDIGGSVRIPSGFQGLYGLRGSSNRLPYCNIRNSMANQPLVCSVVGPMATDIEDLKLFTKLVIDSKPWLKDPKCPPIPWREFKVSEKLSFGFIDVSVYSYIHPPIKRALKMVKERLLKEGHEIIQFEPPISFPQMAELWHRIVCADGGREISEECRRSGEPIREEILVANDDGSVSKEACITEFWDDAGLQYKYQQEFDQYWLSTSSMTKTGRPVDGLLLPLLAVTSYKIGDCKNFFSLFFTQAFNLLDYTVVTTPVTKADRDVDLIETQYQPLNKLDELSYKYYDPELFHGTPVGIQAVAPRYEEERAIHLSQTISKVLNS